MQMACVRAIWGAKCAVFAHRQDEALADAEVRCLIILNFVSRVVSYRMAHGGWSNVINQFRANALQSTPYNTSAA